MPVQWNLSYFMCLIFLILFFHVRLLLLIDFFLLVSQKYIRISHFAPHPPNVACYPHSIFSILFIQIIFYFLNRKIYEAIVGIIYSILLPVSQSSFKSFSQPVTSSPCDVITPLHSIRLSNNFKLYARNHNYILSAASSQTP
jgi:hypothetical protein